MRLRNIPGAEETLENHPDIVVHEPEAYRGRFQERFETVQPLHIEIGTGKGQFIVEMAKQHPDINFIGIELQTSVILRVLEKVLEEEVTNVQLINANAEVILELLEEEEVDAIYLNFSDPWPKNRHEKRRLTYKGYLEKYERLLKEDGQVAFKTDNRKLFEYSLQSFTAYGVNLETVSLDLHADADIPNVMTEYEERYSKKGNVIYLAIITFPN